MPPKKTTQAVAKTVTVEPVVEKVETKPEVVPEPVSADVPEVDKFAQVLDKLQSFINDAKELTVLVKAMQKDHVKLQKQTSKKVKKSAGGEGTKRSPSGFAKPTKLSDELCDFLGVTKGSSMARTIVTKHINEYIKKNNLQDAADKRHIIPDAKLKNILSIKEGDKLTYFNLQTYIKQHFKKE
jgi:chromatin remodeling complex protein RSC6